MFKPGQSGNPKGRPRGAKSVFADQFIKDLQADWAEYGIGAIVQTRETRPDLYLRVCASLVPKDYNLTVTDQRQLNEYSTAELLAIRDQLATTGESGSAGKTAKLHDVH